MPVYLGPMTRRELLQRAAAGAGALACPTALWPGAGADEERFVLYSDTHIAESAAEMRDDVNMADHLKQAVSEVLAADWRPSAVLVNGDCAYLNGLAGDYAQFVGLLQPLRESRLPIHFLLGNHDNRDNVRSGVLQATSRLPVADKLAGMIRSRHANLFLLDSLDRTNVTPGLLGEGQLRWLARSLDMHAERPAVIFVHHQPNYAEFGPVGGLQDTEPFFSLIASRSHVKALFFGHTHHWMVKEREGIHCVNLPPVAYVFNPADPSGWVDLRLHEYGMTLRFNSLDKKHKAHGEEHRLVWR